MKHRDGWEVNLYIAPSLEARLRSRDSEVRDGARRSVCIRFREACKAAYPDKWPYADGYPFIEWGHLSVTKIEQAEPTRQAPSQADERHCCDDDNCVVCDIGNHGFCRKGCTLFR